VAIAVICDPCLEQIPQEYRPRRPTVQLLGEPAPCARCRQPSENRAQIDGLRLFVIQWQARRVVMPPARQPGPDPEERLLPGEIPF